MSERDRVGVVVIGRNEGDRLVRCLRSLGTWVGRTVYVDSGSTDGSVQAARDAGAGVVVLDMSRPFSMARGRNAGFRRLQELHSGVEYVQFFDGDCEVVPGWIERAARAFDETPGVVAVAGRRRERHRDATVYNRLCDMEWDGPAGVVRSTGGDVMIRAESLRAEGGFNERMIAGEEPELCVRLRANGGRILRLDEDMTVHDAAMVRFSQWWRRAARAGHAYAEGADLHGRGPERHNLRQTRSAFLWGALVPAGILTALLATALTSWALVAAGGLLLGYPLLLLRVYGHRRGHGDAPADALLYASFCVLAKAPQLAGILKYRRNRRRGRRSGLMEYKEPAGIPATGDGR